MLEIKKIIIDDLASRLSAIDATLGSAQSCLSDGELEQCMVRIQELEMDIKFSHFQEMIILAFDNQDTSGK